MRTTTTILLLTFLLVNNFPIQAKPRFFIASSGNCKEADEYIHYFESRIFNNLKKNFPCVEISSRSNVAATLEHERQRTLLGGETQDLVSIGSAMHAEYLVSLKVRILQATALIEAFCIDTRKNKTISRVFFKSAPGDAAIDAVENASEQLIEGLKKYEICPFTGPINVTVKTEQNNKEVESYAVYCNGVDGTFHRLESISSNSVANWRLNKTGKYTTSGSLSYSLFEESIIEEQNPCALCPSGKKGPIMHNEKTERSANIRGLSNESVAEGIQINDARTEITFLDNGTYIIKIIAASNQGVLKIKTDLKIEGCEKRSANEIINKKADVPLDEILGPFNGTSSDKVLSGSKTIVREDSETKEKTTITYSFNLRND